MATPRAGLAQLSEGQAQKVLSINENFALLEALTVGGAISRTTTTPPGSPAEGDIYIVPSGATGAWAGQTNNIAHYLNSAWVFYTPKAGYHLFVIADARFYWFNSSSWVLVA